jgi:creatinine amidohydrolase
VSADAGHTLLTQRCATLPDVLRRAVEAAAPSLPSSMCDARRWVVTATGASEGPARLFAWALRRYAGRCAEFVTLSSFAIDDAPRGDALALFSQELSPNARLGLTARSRYAHTLLVTATPDHPDVRAAAIDGVEVCVHPPASEPSLLLRVHGPAAATVLALRLAEGVARAPGSIVAPSVWERVPDAVERAFSETLGDARELSLDGSVAIVTAPDGAEAAHGLRWKWLEGTGTCDPPCWDVLQFAHGPWQLVVDRPYTLLALERAHDGTRALFDRLASMLSPERHALVRLRATLPGAAAFFEHDARMNALVCATLPRAGRDLVRWPGFGADGPLYRLGG